MRKVLALATSAVVAAAGTVLAHPAAATVCSPVTELQNVPNVVITKTGRAVVQVTVRLTQPCWDASAGIYTNVEVIAVNPGLDRTTAYMQRVSGSDQDGTWTGEMYFSNKSNVGKWYVDVVVTTTRSRPTYSTEQVRNVRQDTFLLRRDTRVTLSAKPRPVERGQSLRLTGHVSRLTYKLNWVDWRQKRVKLYFRRAGQTDRHLVTRVSTNSDGRFRAVVTGMRTGRWYAKVAGTLENTARWSSGVRVRVTR